MPVEFHCPDVRIRTCEDTRADPFNAYWAHLKPGVAYEGGCGNFSCPSYTEAGRCGVPPGRVVCNMGFGKHRPNEDYCYDQIVCPACKVPFFPERFFFQSSSAKINFCIAGESVDQVSISEAREYKSRVFGKYGQPIIYTMLVVEVDQPGVHPDIDELQSLDRSMHALPRPPTTRQFMENFLRTFLGAGGSVADNSRLLRDCISIDPQTVSYIQDSISNRFQCGRKVLDTMEKLKNGRIKIFQSKIPPIKIFQWEGKWHSQDNRRLWAFKQAGLRAVPAKVIDIASVHRDKFTTLNRGCTIRVRGLD